MTHNKKADRVKQMKIAQLCEESGFKRSTIHYYLNIGLLTPPSKVGLNLSLYDKSHLDQLRPNTAFAGAGASPSAGY